MAVHALPLIEEVDIDRCESIGGLLVEKPVPTLTHGSLQLRTVDLLRSASLALGMVTLPEVSIDQTEADVSDWMTPDVIVSEAGGFREKRNGHALPPVTLAVELLSPGQSFFGMRQKAERYLAWGIRSVWLIDPDSKAALCFASEVGARSGQLVFEGSLQAGKLCIELSDLFS